MDVKNTDWHAQHCANVSAVVVAILETIVSLKMKMTMKIYNCIIYADDMTIHYID